MRALGSIGHVSAARLIAPWGTSPEKVTRASSAREAVEMMENIARVSAAHGHARRKLDVIPLTTVATVSISPCSRAGALVPTLSHIVPQTSERFIGKFNRFTPSVVFMAPGRTAFGQESACDKDYLVRPACGTMTSNNARRDAVSPTQAIARCLAVFLPLRSPSITMITRLLLVAIFATTSLSANAQSTAPTPGSTGQSVETIVCIRHGEKPHGGLGQLTCRGLNRALALPNVLITKYGTPQYIFAPNPTDKSDGGRYNYIRPLATIEPTAIRCGLPVNTEFGYKEIAEMEAELRKPQYRNAVVFISWEHFVLDILVQKMMADNGADPAQVPPWPEDDYDTIFVIKIVRSTGAGIPSISFSIDHEGLNGSLKDTCP